MEPDWSTLKTKLALSVCEVAGLLGVSAGTVRQWARAGRLDVVWLSSGSRRRHHFIVPTQSLQRFLEGARHER